MKYYLYRHIRLDKDEPFYIGIGTKIKGYSNHSTEYLRAYSKASRSNFWKGVVSKTEYDVEILVESDNYEFIKEKEKEFINLYGRRNLGKGLLCNLTDGGDGTLGIIVSEETKDKLKLSRKNRNFSFLDKKIYQYDLEGNFIKEWINITEASASVGVDNGYLGKLIKHNLNGNFCKGFYWYSYLTANIKKKKFREDNRKGVIMLDCVTKEPIKIFNSTLEAYTFFGKKKCSGSIIRACREDRIVFGFKWRKGGES